MSDTLFYAHIIYRSLNKSQLYILSCRSLVVPSLFNVTISKYHLLRFNVFYLTMVNSVDLDFGRTIQIF